MSEQQNFFNRKSWHTSIGFYLTMFCSSFGLIHIWRFPYIVIDNGGGAFLYVYFLVAAILGSCYVMAELIVGKISQKSLWQAFNRWTSDSLILNPQTTKWNRWLFFIVRRVSEISTIMCALVAAYYSVISGWVLLFLSNFIWQGAASDQNPILLDATEQGFFIQWGVVVFHISLCSFFVRRGFRRGLETLGFVVAPLFLLLLLYLCFLSLSLPGASEAVRFLLYPDFTKITWVSLSQAIGHMVLSLGLGLGTLITFGSYFPATYDITSAATRVVLFSIAMSFLAVFILCPMVLGAPYAVFGPKLLFQTLPQLVLKFHSGHLILMAFYTTMYLASLVATTGLVESLVTNLSDRWNWPRRGALRASFLFLMSIVTIPLLSSTIFRNFRWMGGVSLLESVDGILVNFALPLLAMGVAIGASLLIPQRAIRHEFDGTEIEQEISHFYPIWKGVIWWVSPIVILLGFSLRFF